MDQFQELFAYIKDLQRRVGILETVPQNQMQIWTDSGGTPRILIDGKNGVIKASRAGFDVRTCAEVNLTFDSSKSAFREVQMQCIPQQRFTDQSSYIDLYDGQIQLNFQDWTDENMYVEFVMKTGAGTGHMALKEMISGSVLVDVSTTSTTAVSVRSGIVSKPSTGVYSYRAAQRIDSGGGAFTDVYIGRVIMRYDF